VCIIDCVYDTVSDAVLDKNLVDVARLLTCWERLRTEIGDLTMCTDLVFDGGQKNMLYAFL